MLLGRGLPILLLLPHALGAAVQADEEELCEACTPGQANSAALLQHRRSEAGGGQLGLDE
eukprot:CAMPEP_0204564376 /NCGR_PEP_ID=MMETSP0661-20131031/34854_1 /ASSEMBLY_ACC=CAM_ASM_000606 /TAXON_ID=109239 /ORGANISM="Alexandrium margalefi, Strain AMGDE01CS-322" /LENGTH=59 /DNA_ID=CAMNT_0051572013 /DNA_START=84 /DNA_END=260 /DNA_ORIENTATION=+